VLEASAALPKVSESAGDPTKSGSSEVSGIEEWSEKSNVNGISGTGKIDPFHHISDGLFG
jgi:hypothetical protein